MDLDKILKASLVIDFSQDSAFDLLDKDFSKAGTLIIADNKISYYSVTGDKKVFESESDFKDFQKDNGFVFKVMSKTGKWHEYNPNPQNKDANDCALRAFCKAFDMTWEEAFDITSAQAKKDAVTFNENENLKKIIRQNGFEKDKDYPENSEKITLNEFALIHPSGTYLCFMRGHIACVSEGEFWDSWDSGSKKVNEVWKPI